MNCKICKQKRKNKREGLECEERHRKNKDLFYQSFLEESEMRDNLKKASKTKKQKKIEGWLE